MSSSFLYTLFCQIVDDDPDLVENGLAWNSLWWKHLAPSQKMQFSAALKANTTLTRIAYTWSGDVHDHDVEVDANSTLSTTSPAPWEDLLMFLQCCTNLEDLSIDFVDQNPSNEELSHTLVPGISVHPSLRHVELIGHIMDNTSTNLVGGVAEQQHFDDQNHEVGDGAEPVTRTTMANSVDGDRSSHGPCILTSDNIFCLAHLDQITLRGIHIEVPNSRHYTHDGISKTQWNWAEVTFDSCFVVGGRGRIVIGEPTFFGNDVNLDTGAMGRSDGLLWWFPLAVEQLQVVRLTNCSVKDMSTCFSTFADQTGNNLIVLDLTNCQLDIDCCPGLAKALDASPHLMELSLADNPNIGEGGIQRLSETLNSSLQKIDVTNCQINEDALQNLVDTFPFLKAINLTANPLRSFDHVCVEPIEELVLESMTWGLDDPSLASYLKRAPPRRINLSGNYVGRETLLALSQGCESVVLAGCQLGDDGLGTLLLGRQQQLEQRRLDQSRGLLAADSPSSYTPSSSSSLSSLSSSNNSPTLSFQELFIPYNNITNQGIAYLVEAFAFLTDLTTLSMECNNFDTDGLHEVVEKNGDKIPHKLQELNMWNQQLGGGINGGSPPSGLLVKLQDELEHILQLNRSGKSLLFEDEIRSSLWPMVFAEADRVYGVNAIYNFLQTRPDIAQHSNFSI